MLKNTVLDAKFNHQVLVLEDYFGFGIMYMLVY